MENADEREEDSPESRVPSLVRSVLTQKKTLVGGAGACEMEGAPASLVFGRGASSDPSPPDGVPVAAIPRVMASAAKCPTMSSSRRGNGEAARVFPINGQQELHQRVPTAAGSAGSCEILLRLSSDCPFCFCALYLADKTAWSWQ